VLPQAAAAVASTVSAASTHVEPDLRVIEVLLPGGG
jgi:hypothetical protein